MNNPVIGSKYYQLVNNYNKILAEIEALKKKLKNFSAEDIGYGTGKVGGGATTADIADLQNQIIIIRGDIKNLPQLESTLNDLRTRSNETFSNTTGLLYMAGKNIEEKAAVATYTQTYTDYRYTYPLQIYAGRSTTSYNLTYNRDDDMQYFGSDDPVLAGGRYNFKFTAYGTSSSDLNIYSKITWTMSSVQFAYYNTKPIDENFPTSNESCALKTLIESQFGQQGDDTLLKIHVACDIGIANVDGVGGYAGDPGTLPKSNKDYNQVDKIELNLTYRFEPYGIWTLFEAIYDEKSYTHDALVYDELDIDFAINRTTLKTADAVNEAKTYVQQNLVVRSSIFTGFYMDGDREDTLISMKFINDRKDIKGIVYGNKFIMYNGNPEAITEEGEIYETMMISNDRSFNYIDNVRSLIIRKPNDDEYKNSDIQFSVQLPTFLYETQIGNDNNPYNLTVTGKTINFGTTGERKTMKLDAAEFKFDANIRCTNGNVYTSDNHDINNNYQRTRALTYDDINGKHVSKHEGEYMENIAGSLDVEKTIYADGLNVGDITAENITATTSLKSEDTLTVEGLSSLLDDVTIGTTGNRKKLTVNGTTTSTGAVTIGTSSTVSPNQLLNVYGQSTTHNTATFKSTITVNGQSNLEGNVIVGKQAVGDTPAVNSSITVMGGTTTANAVIGGAPIGSNTLSVTGGSAFNGDVNIGSNGTTYKLTINNKSIPDDTSTRLSTLETKTTDITYTTANDTTTISNNVVIGSTTDTKTLTLNGVSVGTSLSTINDKLTEITYDATDKTKINGAKWSDVVSNASTATSKTAGLSRTTTPAVSLSISDPTTFSSNVTVGGTFIFTYGGKKYTLVVDASTGAVTATQVT